MSIVFYVVVLAMTVFAVRLLFAKTVLNMLYQLSFVAVCVLLVMVMMSAHIAVILDILLYGLGVLLIAGVMVFLITHQSHLSELREMEYKSHIDKPQMKKSQWLMLSISSFILIGVFLFFIFQSVGRFSVNELTPTMVAKTLWQDYSMVLVVTMFWVVVSVIFIIEMLSMPKKQRIQALQVAPEVNNVLMEQESP